LPAANSGFLNAAVIAPFAGVIEVGLTNFGHLAVAEEGIETLGAQNVRRNVPPDTGVPIHPLDLKSFLFEQTFFIGDDFG
jgi:hypothetical protein